MTKPETAARLASGNRKNGTKLTADKVINSIMDGVKKNLSGLYPELKKIKDPTEMENALAVIVDLNPSVKTFNFPHLLDAQDEIVKIFNSLQSIASRDRKKEREQAGSAYGVKTDTKTGSHVPSENKRTNKDIDKELDEIKTIMAGLRKTPGYIKMLKVFKANDPKTVADDFAKQDLGKSLNSDILNSTRVSKYLPDLDNSKIPGIADAVKNIKQILVVAYAEHRAYADADPAGQKALLESAKYVEGALKGLKQVADAMKKGFGLPEGKTMKKSIKSGAVKKRVVKGKLKKA
jgi:hypothetical protein